MMKIKILIVLFVFFFGTLFVIAQSQKKLEAEKILDSINKSQCVNKALFNGYIIRGKFEFIPSFHRNRLTEEGGDFKPLSFTYNVYLPVQLELNYLHRQAKDKLLKVNPVFFVHHSLDGNYGLGFSIRLNFLIIKNIYLAYQLGLGWFEVTNSKASDGLTNKGLNFHHILSLSYEITKHWGISINALHVSNGNLFSTKGNTQDGVGLGVSYQIK